MNDHAESRGDRQIIALADGEIRADRVELRNAGQNVRGADQVPDLRGRDTGDAINGRAHFGPGQVQFGSLLLCQRSVQGGLIRLHGLHIVVQLRLGNGLLFRQRRVARDIEL